MLLSPLSKLSGLYLLKTTHINNTKNNSVNFNLFFSSNDLTVKKKNKTAPQIITQKEIAIPNTYGPKLDSHSGKYGCLFSATVTPTLSETGFINGFFKSFILSIT